SAGIDLVNKAVDNGVDLKAFVNDLIEVLRKIMISKVNPGLSEKIGLELGETLDMKLDQLSQELDLGRLTVMLEKFLTVRNALKNSFIIQLPVELALVELSQEAGPENPAPKAPKTAPETSAPPQTRENTAGPQQQEKQESAGTSTPGQVNKQEICSRWHEVLAKVKKHNHSLSFILKVCHVQDVKEDTVSLAFKHKFHKDRLSDARIKELVEQTLVEVFGKKLAVEPVVDENLETGKEEPASPPQQEPESQESEAPNGSDKPNEDDNFIDNILKTFGGKVIK
ncbi:MAG: hypothetical protein R6V40_03760, partial [Candidatus Moraniibacteriota bacterium]